MAFAQEAYEEIRCDTPAAGVARITLAKPGTLNAYTFPMTQELQAAIADFRDDDTLKVLILTGEGERAFCSGGDISGSDPEHSRAVAEAPLGRGREMRDGMQAVVLALTRLDKPVVAAINGVAVAGGLALALACDFRIAADTARLGDTSGKVGLLPDEGGAWLFPRAMGYDRALKMSLLSEIYEAQEAAALGLVTEVVPAADLEGRTLTFAEALAARAPLAVRLVKTMMRRSADMSLEQSMGDAMMAVHIANPSEDVKEGLKAFFEKRPPQFKGR